MIKTMNQKLTGENVNGFKTNAMQEEHGSNNGLSKKLILIKKAK